MSSETIALFPELFPSQGELNTDGLLPSQKLQEYIELRYIRGVDDIMPDQVQPSSVDLRLGRTAWRVTASFLPSRKSTVTEKLQDLLIEELDLSRPTVLSRDNVYIVALKEELALPASVWGKANPKSTTGRLDVFTRALADYVDEFEHIPNGYKGKLYAEVVPRTFNVVVREGARLNQLRLATGDPSQSDAKLRALHKHELLISQEQIRSKPLIEEGLWLSLDLVGTRGSEVVGYKAKRNASPIDLSKVDYYDVDDYWYPILRSNAGKLVLLPDDFYILVSKEPVRIPPQSAAEMIPLDPSVGEFRIHYAGFFDPGFGYGPNDVKGAHAVLEVRSHGVPFLVEDGQRVGRLVFEQMLACPTKIYGRDIGSSYQSQGLALSKQFKRTAGA